MILLNKSLKLRKRMIKMNKKFALLLSALVIFGTASSSLAATKPAAVISKETIPKVEELTPPVNMTAIEYDPKLYPNPNLYHAMASYKSGNYTGAAQELFSYLKKYPASAQGFYYLGMTLANLGDTDAAIEAYEKVITINTNEALVTSAAKGRDCLTGGPLCAEAVIIENEEDPLAEFINAPYDDGFSPELKEQMKVKELETIQKKINKKPELQPEDVEQIKKFDEENSSEALTDNKIAMADGAVSNDEIVSAINTLRQAGMTVSIQPTAQASYQNPQMAEMSMMLGGNQNQNNDPMAQMFPYMMQAGTQDGAQNVNPQVIQAMMMNSMMSNLDFNTSDDK